MELINQSHEILKIPTNLKLIELAGRTCYQSHDKITEDSVNLFVEKMVNSGHHAMIEFEDIVVRFITNRGVSHEFVRHRLCNFAQESTRYVRKSNVTFIKPVWYDRSTDEQKENFLISMIHAEKGYRQALNLGWIPEQAREILTNALKTEIVVKCNLREWRHILNLRCSKYAHPQFRALLTPLLIKMHEKLLYVFDDIYDKYMNE